MLIPYNPYEPAFNQWRRRARQLNNIRYYASDMMEYLGIKEEQEINSVVERALKACAAMDIPIEENFMCVYRSGGTGLIPDWKLSSLACYLVTINGDPANPKIARAQLFFVL